MKNVKESRQKNIERQLSRLSKEINRLNEPTYHFNIGDEVRYGCITKSIVSDILYDGKIYVLDCTNIKEELGREVITNDVRVCTWVDIRPIETKDTNLTKQNKFFISFSNSTIQSLLYRYYAFEVDMNPSYQRDYVWDKVDKVSLIDSIFNNVDIGKITFLKHGYDSEMLYEILDGKQRTNALIEFYENKFQYKGFYYNDLSDKDKAHFKSYPLSLGEIAYTNEADALECFIKLNTSGKVMDDSEIDKAKVRLHYLNHFKDKDKRKPLYNFVYVPDMTKINEYIVMGKIERNIVTNELFFNYEDYFPKVKQKLEDDEWDMDCIKILLFSLADDIENNIESDKESIKDYIKFYCNNLRFIEIE